MAKPKPASAARRFPMIDAETGVVVVVTASTRRARLADRRARDATERDLRLAGRRDLIPLLTA